MPFLFEKANNQNGRENGSQIIKNPLNLMDIKFEDTSNSYFIRHKTFQFFFQDPVYKDSTFDSYVDNKDSYMQDQLRKTSDGKKIFFSNDIAGCKTVTPIRTREILKIILIDSLV